MPSPARLIPGVIAVVAFLAGSAAADVVSFRNDVMAVLSKAGCNMGACHGNQNGKGGFRLSLRGEDPAFDYAALTRDLSGRRANAMDAERSLVLLKPTMQVPHEGGRRFAADSPEYRTLRDWIASGLPADGDGTPRLVRLDVSPTEVVLVEPEREVALQAVAEFADGSTRDVTRLAVYELASPGTVSVSTGGLARRLEFGETTIIVRYLERQVAVRLAFVPERPGFAWSGPEPANFIDEHVFGRLRARRINPAPVCDDTTFVRRAHLDLLGLIPTADEARAFLQDPRPDKRARLVEDLLRRQEFADFWALKWSDLLRNEEKTLDRKGVQNYHAWIRRGIADGKPLDRFVRELVASRGSTYVNPAANYYRAMREPLMRAESTAQLFLGIRLQCAKCHNHPFDRWTQDDYYAWANLFSRVDYKIVENNRRDSNDSHEFDGEQIVYMKREGEVDNPRRGTPEAPRFLAEAGGEVDRERDRLEQLAEWLTSPRNERFAWMQVNRIWYHLMGRGIVDPIDDFRATNPPSHPALLEALAEDFVAGGFDLRHAIRTIMASKTYQLSSEPGETNRDDETGFSRAVVRNLTAEQTLDSLSRALGAPVEFVGYPPGMRAGELPGVEPVRRRDRRPTAGDQFLKLFGKPPRLQTCECERPEDSTLGQAFQLVSGPLMNELLTTPDNRLAALLESGQDSAEIVETLYWTALSRPPTDEERQTVSKHIAAATDRRQALEDVAWALLASNEFLLRR